MNTKQLNALFITFYLHPNLTAAINLKNVGKIFNMSKLTAVKNDSLSENLRYMKVED